MNDLSNSFFKFNNSFKFNEFNQDENQNENKDENQSESNEEESKDKDNNFTAPELSLTVDRKVMNDWLDAEYNSSFQYKKVEIKPFYNNNIYTAQKKENSDSAIDIDDPVVIYDYLKKYTNFLYDYNCPKDIEKKIVDTLVDELKSYYKEHSAKGLDSYLNTLFIKLKNKYLSSITHHTKPGIPASEIKYKQSKYYD